MSPEAAGEMALMLNRKLDDFLKKPDIQEKVAALARALAMIAGGDNGDMLCLLTLIIVTIGRDSGFPGGHANFVDLLAVLAKSLSPEPPQ